MPRTCLNVFNSRDADEPASVAPGYYAYPFDDYDRAAVGPFATPTLAICAARAVEARVAQSFAISAEDLLTDFDRDLAALLGPAAPDISRKLDGRLDVFDRVCVLASRTGQPLTVDELIVVRRLILAGATDAEAVLADMRVELRNAQFEAEVA